MENREKNIKLFRSHLDRKNIKNVSSEQIQEVIKSVNPTGNLSEDEKNQIKELLVNKFQTTTLVDKTEVEDATAAMVRAEAKEQNLEFNNQEVSDIANMAKEQDSFEISQIEAVKEAMIQFLNRSHDHRTIMLAQAMNEVNIHEAALMRQFQNNLGGTLNNFFRERNQNYHSSIGNILSNMAEYKPTQAS